MTAARLVAAARHDLFATPVMTFEHDAEDLDRRLGAALANDARYTRVDQAEQSDAVNLCALADAEPVYGDLESLFVARLRDYLAAVEWRGAFDVGMQMFANYAPARHYVPSHNHVAHIAAVYYVRTPQFDGKAVLEASDDISDYWRPEEGVLILHDPRFNASLMGGWQHYARVYPRPGLLIMFPAFLWHQVTPHFMADTRISVAANFTLTSAGDAGLSKRLAINV